MAVVLADVERREEILRHRPDVAHAAFGRVTPLADRQRRNARQDVVVTPATMPLLALRSLKLDHVPEPAANFTPLANEGDE